MERHLLPLEVNVHISYLNILSFDRNDILYILHVHHFLSLATIDVVSEFALFWFLQDDITSHGTIRQRIIATLLELRFSHCGRLSLASFRLHKRI